MKMRIKLLLLSLFIAIGVANLSAQKEASKFGLELYGTPTSISFNKKQPLNIGGIGINGIYFPYKNFAVKVGFEQLHLEQNKTKTFQNLSMVRLGIGYTFYRSADDIWISEINLSSGNEMNTFGKFSNFDIKSDLRLYFNKSFFLGVGVKYLNLERLSFTTYDKKHTNLIFTVGYRFAY